MDKRILPKLPQWFKDEQPPVLTKTDLMPDHVAFVLRGILSEKQCQWIIDQFEKMGYTHVSDAGYNKNYRNNFRLIASSVELSQFIMQRIESVLEKEIVVTQTGPVGARVWCRGEEGTFALHSLNEMFRICKYDSGGHFSPHCDACYAPSASFRSFKTFMIYLNGNLDGGATNFLDDSQPLASGKDNLFRGSKDYIRFKVPPEAGMALVFNHDILHEGEQLASGVKYIMRSDIMFKRAADPELSEKEQRATIELKKAQKLEQEGKHQEAAKCYQKAFHLCPELETAV